MWSWLSRSIYLALSCYICEVTLHARVRSNLRYWSGPEAAGQIQTPRLPLPWPALHDSKQWVWEDKRRLECGRGRGLGMSTSGAQKKARGTPDPTSVHPDRPSGKRAPAGFPRLEAEGVKRAAGRLWRGAEGQLTWGGGGSRPARPHPSRRVSGGGRSGRQRGRGLQDGSRGGSGRARPGPSIIWAGVGWWQWWPRVKGDRESGRKKYGDAARAREREGAARRVSECVIQACSRGARTAAVPRGRPRGSGRPAAPGGSAAATRATARGGSAEASVWPPAALAV